MRLTTDSPILQEAINRLGVALNITKRNHYNPCFWTALWSPEYFKAFRAGASANLRVREQRVYALGVKSNKVISMTTANVHFDKNLAFAEITRETAEEFCKRHFPDQFKSFQEENATAPYPVFIDFEDILSKLEELPPYTVLLEVARREEIASAEEKAFLGCFVFFQLLRSHAIMNSLIEWLGDAGISKFEHFVMLKWALVDQGYLMRCIAPLVNSRWTLYRSAEDAFPLTDSPVLVRPQSILVALSPRLLLEIERRLRASENQWRVREIKAGKLAEFRRRTIGNTFREIIFGNPEILEAWCSSGEFKRRVEEMGRMVSYNAVLARDRRSELWSVNAYGNQG